MLYFQANKNFKNFSKFSIHNIWKRALFKFVQSGYTDYDTYSLVKCSRDIL